MIVVVRCNANGEGPSADGTEQKQAFSTVNEREDRIAIRTSFVLCYSPTLLLVYAIFRQRRVGRYAY